MKSFRLFHQAVTPPTRQAADYSNSERNRFREAFSSLASSYRRRERIAASAIGGFMGCILLGLVLPKAVFPWVFIPIGGLWLVAVAAGISAPRLVCPGCSNDLERRIGQYCPECGSSQLQPGTWFRSPHCSACGKSMRRGKGRSYKIHACTHCGLLLDEKGL